MVDKRFFSCSQPLTVEAILNRTSGNLANAADHHLQRLFYGVASLTQAKETDITYGTMKHRTEVQQTQSGLCFVEESMKNYVPTHCIAVIVDNASLAYTQCARYFYTEHVSQSTIHPTAVIHETATIGEGTSIGAYSVIGPGVVIGHHCRIDSHVTITHTLMGDYVVVATGARIGQEGFGFVFDKQLKRHIRIPQLGRVVIGDYTDIGANSCIDRGGIHDTVIGTNVIIDNLVQIGHNCHIGNGAILVGQAGLAGSVDIGDYAVLGGQVGVADHLTIGAGAQIAAQAGITRNVAAGEKMMGYPAKPMAQYLRQLVQIDKFFHSKNKQQQGKL